MATHVRSYTASLVLAGAATAGTAWFNDPANSGGGAPINGQLMSIQVQFGLGTMAGGTCLIQTKGMGGPSEVLTNYVGGTSQFFFPRAQAMGTNGGTLASQFDRMPVDDSVSMVVSGASAGTITSRLQLYTDR